MANVQFYQGTRAQLNNYPLDLGTIYFIPEERRLYIDTVENSSPKRMPVIGYSGLSFYLQIPTSQLSNNTIDLKIYYESSLSVPSSEKDFYSSDISDIIGDNSIIYAGYPYYFNNGIFQKYTRGSNFYISSILPNNITVTREGSEELPDVIYLYCYCPNPLPSSFKIPVDYTVYTQTITLYGTKNLNGQWVWNENEKYYEYNTDFSLEDIDVRNYPFIIKPDDDSLENYMEWNGAIFVKDLLTTGGKIRFYSTSSYAPWFNIEVDIIVFIGEESKNGYWRGKHYFINQICQNYSVDEQGSFILSYKLKDIASLINKEVPIERFFLNYPNGSNKNLYSYVSNINFLESNETLQLKGQLTNDDITIKFSDIEIVDYTNDFSFDWKVDENNNRVNIFTYADTISQNFNSNEIMLEKSLKKIYALKISTDSTLQSVISDNTYSFYYGTNKVLVKTDLPSSETVYLFYWNNLLDTWTIYSIIDLEVLSDTHIKGILFPPEVAHFPLTIIQTNGISNMYKMTIPNQNKITSSGKIIDETTGQIQPRNGYWIKSDWGKRSLNDALINLEEDIYIVQMTPTNNDKSLARIAGKHNPVVVPLDNYEEFNKIIECRVYQDGNIYFFAVKDNLPTVDIPIMVIDFK